MTNVGIKYDKKLSDSIVNYEQTTQPLTALNQIISALGIENFTVTHDVGQRMVIISTLSTNNPSGASGIEDEASSISASKSENDEQNDIIIGAKPEFSLDDEVVPGVTLRQIISQQEQAIFAATNPNEVVETSLDGKKITLGDIERNQHVLIEATKNSDIELHDGSTISKKNIEKRQQELIEAMTAAKP